MFSWEGIWQLISFLLYNLISKLDDNLRENIKIDKGKDIIGLVTWTHQLAILLSGSLIVFLISHHYINRIDRENVKQSVFNNLRMLY